MKELLAVALVVLLSPLAQVLTPYAFAQSSTTYPPTYVREDSNLLYIGNGFIELQFQKSLGGIYSIINKVTGEDYRTNKLVGAVLFKASGPLASYDSNGASSVTYSYSSNDSESILTLKHAFSGSSAATVTTTVRVIRNSSLSFWRISLVIPGMTVIDKVLFPRIDGIGQVGNQTAGNYLLLGDGYGTMLTDLYTSFITRQFQGSNPGIDAFYPSIAGDLQLMAIGNSQGGLYLSTYDTNGNPKEFDAWKDQANSTTMNLAVVHRSPEQANSTLSPPYDTIVGVYKGDWYAAANMYRSWALKQWWTAQGPLSQRSDVPAWFKRGFDAFTMWSYDTYNDHDYPGEANHVFANFSQIPVLLAQTLAKANSPVLVDWRGWEKFGAWEAPDVFPPHEGWASFNETIAKIHSMGQHVVVSLSADDIFTNYPGFDKTWLDCAVRNPDGTVHYENVSVAPNLTYASVSCPRFQDWLVNAVTTLAKSGVDGVRLDANFNFISVGDYNNATNHPPGYGSWWASSWKSIFTRIKVAVSQINPEFLLGSEGLPESFIPWNQLWTDRSGDVGSNGDLAEFGAAVKPVDLFQYVYSGYTVGLPDAIFGGNLGLDSQAYTVYRDFAQTLEVTQGSVVGGFFFGALPLYSDLERSLVWDSSFFTRDFSPFGTREPPPTVSVPTITLTVAGAQSGTAGNFVAYATSYTTPAILSGAWLSQDNRLGYLFVNLDSVSHSFTFVVNTSYLAQGTNFELLSFNNDTAMVSPLNPSNPSISVNLPAKQTQTVEVVPSSRVPQLLLEYAAFKGSYISGTTILNAPTTGLNFDAAQSTLVAAQGAYASQNFSGSIALSLQALNTTAQSFRRFGQLLSGGQSYLEYLAAFNDAAKSGNYSGAFDSAQSAINVGVSSTTQLFPSSSLGPGRTLLIEQAMYPKGRVDVGSAQHLSFRVVRADDGSYPVGAKLSLNDSTVVVTTSGWANFTVSQKYAGKGASLLPRGSDANGSLRILAAKGSPPNFVWDEVVITLSTNSSRIPIGSNAPITWTGKYAYDNSSFTGMVSLNDSITKTTPGVYAYAVNKVFDSKYNLTAFVSNVVSVEFISPQTSTTTSSTGGAGIPEFPTQFLGAAVLTAIVVASYSLLRRKSLPHS